MFKDKCGVVGVWNSEAAAHLCYAGLYALQHRGQESAGIAIADRGKIKSHKGMGKVMDVFSEEILKDELIGKYAIGHTRYSTRGGSHIENAQPLFAELASGEVAIAHNGQITNGEKLKRELQEEGSIFQTFADTEVIFHLMARYSHHSFLERLLYALKQIRGAFSLVLLHKNKLIGVRDPHGFRPLCLGKKEESFVLASESCVLDIMEAEFIREVAPGEVIMIDEGGIESFFPFDRKEEKFCVFELIYFARPDSLFKGKSVLSIRKALGKQLAEEAPCPKGDLVMSVPDSSNPAALGYAQALGIPFELGLIRNHYIGRTFIEPTQSIRDWRARIKYNPVRPIVQGKSIVMVDDSIVRGTTCSRLIHLLKEYGAKEIHLRVSSPIIYHPCYYGIDTPEHEELIGHRLKEQEKICQHLETDSLHYLSLEGLQKVMEETTHTQTFCNACFSGDYPLFLEK